jgi:hypothetical protein
LIKLFLEQPEAHSGIDEEESFTSAQPATLAATDMAHALDLMLAQPSTAGIREMRTDRFMMMMTISARPC